MEADKIIIDLYKSKELDDCILKFVPAHLLDDFKQEVFLLLCEMDKEKLVNIKDIKFYTVRIIINLATQVRNIFHKKYLLKNIEFEEKHVEQKESDIKERLEFEKYEEEVLKHIGEMDNHFNTFFYRGLTEVLKKYGSMREVSRKTGIPIATVSRGIKKVREYLIIKNV